MKLETIIEAIEEFEIVKNMEQAEAWWKNWIGNQALPRTELDFLRGAISFILKWIKEYNVSNTVAE